jgi:hypothetical protein
MGRWGVGNARQRVKRAPNPGETEPASGRRFALRRRASALLVEELVKKALQGRLRARLADERTHLPGVGAAAAERRTVEPERAAQRAVAAIGRLA